MNNYISCIIVNKNGFFGEYVFNQHLISGLNFKIKMNLENSDYEEFDIEKIPDNKNKLYYLKYPSYEELRKNINVFENYSIIFLLDETQTKELAFLKQFYNVQEMDYLLNCLEHFTGHCYEGETREESLKIAQKNKKMKIFIIAYEFGNELNEFSLSTLKVMRGQKIDEYFKMEFIFNIDNFKNLNSKKYPNTKQLVEENKYRDLDEVCESFFNESIQN